MLNPVYLNERNLNKGTRKQIKTRQMYCPQKKLPKACIRFTRRLYSLYEKMYLLHTLPPSEMYKYRVICFLMYLLTERENSFLEYCNKSANTRLYCDYKP